MKQVHVPFYIRVMVADALLKLYESTCLHRTDMAISDMAWKYRPYIGIHEVHVSGRWNE